MPRRYADALSRVVILLALGTLGSLTVFGSLVLFYKLFSYHSSCVQQLESAYMFHDLMGCKITTKSLPQKVREQCFFEEAIIVSIEDKISGTPRLWGCAWTHVLQDYGLCDTASCETTRQLAAWRVLVVSFGIVALAAIAIKFIFWLGIQNEQNIDNRHYNIPMECEQRNYPSLIDNETHQPLRLLMDPREVQHHSHYHVD